MKKIFLMIVISLISGAMHYTCNAGEIKKSKELTAQSFSAVITSKNKVLLYIDGIKRELIFKDVPPVTPVTPQDSIKIVEARKIGNKNVLVAIIYKALTKEDNRIYILEFSQDWKKVQVPYYGTLKYKEHIADKDTEFVKTISVPNPENPEQTLHFIYIFATEQAYGNALYVFRFNLENKLWDSFVKFPLLVEKTVKPIQGYENAKITKISQVNFESTDNPHLYKIFVTFEIAGAEKGYSTTRTYEFFWFITKQDVTLSNIQNKPQP